MSKAKSKSKAKKDGKSNKAVVVSEARSYRELSSVGGINSDWGLTLLSEDSEMWQNAWALTSRVRDLFRSNPLYIAYRETLWSQVFGANGIMYRPRIKETEDRVIHTPDEKAALRAHEERQNRVREFYTTKRGEEFKTESRIRVLHDFGTNGSRVAQVKVGEPDIFACQMISKAWIDWQQSEYCDVRGTRNYKTIRQLRLISAVRDGDFFIRMVMDPRVNKFGFSLQLINAEWCDRFYNTILENGNEVRMGIEYQFTPWGLGKAVAYYFIKRMPSDWQFSIPGAFNFVGGSMHVRVPAEEIIHYARATDADATRPAPWVATTIPSSRQRDQAMLAEVVAWREAACKTGFYYSDVVPEGGVEFALPDPRGVPNETMGPGDKRGLPFGVKWQENNPTHPNTTVAEFRKASIQDGVAGMPGANYSTMANDYEAINFSAGRLQRLDSNECFFLLQTFDIDYAETRIFDKWLEMSLITGAVNLPLAKLEKFKSKIFQGRSFEGVDEVKEVTAAALRVANHFSSDQRECAKKGVDFAEVLFEQAEANMLKEELGINVEKTVQSGAPATAEAEDTEETAATTTAKPKKPVAGKQLSGTRK